MAKAKVSSGMGGANKKVVAVATNINKKKNNKSVRSVGGGQQKSLDKDKPPSSLPKKKKKALKKKDAEEAKTGSKLSVKKEESFEGGGGENSSSNKMAARGGKRRLDPPVKKEGKSKEKGEKEKPDKEKIKKRRKKIDKGIMARRKLERMKKAGFLTAPPRRSAALNASAITNCLLDNSNLANRSNDIKEEPLEPENEADDVKPGPASTSKSTNKSGNSFTKSANQPGSSVSKSARQSNGLTNKSTNQSKSANKKGTKTNPGRPKKKEEETAEKVLKESDELSDSDLDKSPHLKKIAKKKVALKVKKKKEGKSKKFKGSMLDLIVGRRMASMNASAIMNAAYGQRWEKKDPLTMAIEASLRESTADTADKADAAANKTETAANRAETSADRVEPAVVKAELTENIQDIKSEKEDKKVSEKNNKKSDKPVKRLDRTLKVSDSVLTTPKIVDQITKSFEKTGKGFEKKRKSLEKTAAAGKVSETSDGSQVRESELRLKLIENAMMKTNQTQKSKSVRRKSVDGKKSKETKALDSKAEEKSKSKENEKRGTQPVEKKETKSDVPANSKGEKPKKPVIKENQVVISSAEGGTRSPSKTGSGRPVHSTAVQNTLQNKGSKSTPLHSSSVQNKKGSGPPLLLPQNSQGFFDNSAMRTFPGSGSLSAPHLIPSASIVGGVPPTATVPPTLVPVRPLPPVASQGKTLVGTITPVKQTGGQTYSYPGSPYNSVFNQDFVSTCGSGSSVPSTVYSSGYMQSVPSTVPTTVYGSTVPSTVYGSGYVQSVPPQQQNQFYSGQGYSSNAGGSPYSYTYPAYSIQGYQQGKQGAQGGGQGGQQPLYPAASFQGGYYIAAQQGNFLPVPVTTGAQGANYIPVVPVTTGSQPGKGMYGTYGTYAYPGRVIGPIIALGGGTIPVSPATSVPSINQTKPIDGKQPNQQQLTQQQQQLNQQHLNQKQQQLAPKQLSAAGVKPVLRPSTDGSNKPQGKAAPIMAAGASLQAAQQSAIYRTSTPSSLYGSTQQTAGSGTMYGMSAQSAARFGTASTQPMFGTASAQPTAMFGVASTQPAAMFGTSSTQPTDSAVYRAAAIQQYRNSTQKSEHFRSSSAETSYRLNDAGYRQIRPKDGNKDSTQYMGSPRPLQVVGPITGPSGMTVVPGGLVAAVLPQPVQQMSGHNIQASQSSMQTYNNQVVSTPSNQTAKQTLKIPTPSFSASFPFSSTSSFPSSSFSTPFSSSSFADIAGIGLQPERQRIFSANNVSVFPRVGAKEPNILPIVGGKEPNIAPKIGSKEISIVPKAGAKEANVIPRMGGKEIIIIPKEANIISRMGGKEITIIPKARGKETNSIPRVGGKDTVSITPKIAAKESIKVGGKETSKEAEVAVSWKRSSDASSHLYPAKKQRDWKDLPPPSQGVHPSFQQDVSKVASSYKHTTQEKTPQKLMQQGVSKLSSASKLSLQGASKFSSPKISLASAVSKLPASVTVTAKRPQNPKPSRLQHLKPAVEVASMAPNIRDSPNLGGTGHPGLPNGLFALASSMISCTKSPTKLSPKYVKSSPSRRTATHLNFSSPDGEKQRKLYDDPPILSPQVPVKNRQPSRISHSMAKSAADAVKSPKIQSEEPKDGGSDLHPVVQYKLETHAQGVDTMGGEHRSRLQLKPATSPKLVLQNYPTVQSAKSSIVKKLDKSGSSPSLPDSHKGVKRSSSSDPKTDKKKRHSGRGLGGLDLPLVPWKKRSKEAPVNSGGWSWVGDGTVAKVYLHNEDVPVDRISYSVMRHEEGDEEVKVKDCILLASGTRRKDLPFIAKVTALWENPEDGEMMMSLLWYYRPEHTDVGRQEDDLQQEIFASKHRDHTSVACIEDKCFVMTFNEFCRYKKFCKMIEEGVTPPWNIVPDLGDGGVDGGEGGYPRARLLPTCQVPSDRVFLSRKVYDSRCKRMLKNPI